MGLSSSYKNNIWEFVKNMKITIPQPKRRKKGTLFSWTFKVLGIKVPLFFWFSTIWLIYGQFDLDHIQHLTFCLTEAKQAMTTNHLTVTIDLLAYMLMDYGHFHRGHLNWWTPIECYGYQSPKIQKLTLEKRYQIWKFSQNSFKWVMFHKFHWQI